MGTLVSIHSQRVFTEQEAGELLPVVRGITERAASKVQEIHDRLKFVPSEEPVFARLKSELDLHLKKWAIKISKLGCEPRGYWLVDFNAKEGWWTWRLGEEELCFFHTRGSTPEMAPNGLSFPRA